MDDTEGLGLIGKYVQNLDGVSSYLAMHVQCYYFSHTKYGPSSTVGHNIFPGCKL